MNNRWCGALSCCVPAATEQHLREPAVLGEGVRAAAACGTDTAALADVPAGQFGDALSPFGDVSALSGALRMLFCSC